MTSRTTSVSSAPSESRQHYALAISASIHQGVTPVVYDLTGSAIDIGSAESNHIVLSGQGVEPYHLAIREIESRLCALVDLNIARLHHESVWLERRSDDTLFCPEHGRLTRIVESASGDLVSCPLCDNQAANSGNQQANGQPRPLWLLRPLQSGDVFPVGESFEAVVLNQGSPKPVAHNGAGPSTSPWPDTDWLIHPPQLLEPPTTPKRRIQDQSIYSLHDSNLWVWNPPESPFPIFMHQRANRFVTAHALNNPDREVGGLLLGDVYRDKKAKTAYPVISHAIAARYAAEMRGHLTFTHETWLDLTRQREEHHPDREVVGWYHTHPGFGIFLSQWDLQIQRYFFREPWQVALVVDPHDYTAGFFVWANGDILDPQEPHQLFRVAEIEDGSELVRRPRIRIKLGEYVP